MTMTLKDVKILFVDDDENILSGFKRTFRKHFNTHTALDAQQAYEIIIKKGPFAIVVSDMHMPGIDGVQFLAKIKEMAPDTVRMMLTGNSDIEIAVDAVNEGHIFRFLTKPCPSDTMMRALLMGIQQHHLITAERDLLEKTLKGSVQVLTDILSMTNPVAFSRAKRIRHYITELGKLLEIENVWQYEVAAMLSQIGFVTIPQKTVEKYIEGVELNKIETQMVSAFPETGKSLLDKIPRLEGIAEMIKLQQEPIALDKLASPLKNTETVILGALLLKTAIDFDALLCRKYLQKKAVEAMQESGKYKRDVLDMLLKVNVPQLENASTKLFKITDTKNGMLLAEDIRAENGYLVVAKGHEINELLKQRLINYSKQGTIRDSIRVIYSKSLTSNEL